MHSHTRTRICIHTHTHTPTLTPTLPPPLTEEHRKYEERDAARQVSHTESYAENLYAESFGQDDRNQYDVTDAADRAWQEHRHHGHEGLAQRGHHEQHRSGQR